jgi:hypothetical protein
MDVSMDEGWDSRWVGEVGGRGKEGRGTIPPPWIRMIDFY